LLHYVSSSKYLLGAFYHHGICQILVKIISMAADKMSDKMDGSEAAKITQDNYVT